MTEVAEITRLTRDVRGLRLRLLDGISPVARRKPNMPLSLALSIPCPRRR